MKTQQEHIIVRNGIIASIISDTYTFMCLAIILAINHFKLDDSTFGSWVFGIMFFLFIFGKGKSKTIILKGKKEVKEYLKQIK